MHNIVFRIIGRLVGFEFLNFLLQTFYFLKIFGVLSLILYQHLLNFFSCMLQHAFTFFFKLTCY